MRLFAVLGLLVLIIFPLSSYAEETSVIYEGKDGPGKGKHIVFIASDHEYRGEESCPALARILAYHHGFKCTVLFGLDAEGYIQAGSSRIPGLDALKDADMMFCFLRFVAPDDESMQHIIDYIDRGGPVAGLRTTTHAFNGLKGKNSKYNYNSSDENYRYGFGRQILGETWRPPAAGHYGRNHVYSADPLPNSVILATNEVLKTMKPDADPVENKPPQPAIWVRTYKSNSGKEGRVFATTQGASEDIISDGVRRCIVNGVFWCMGLEKHIQPDMDVAFVGPYHPSTFSFGGYRKKVKPADIAGWDTPIWNPKASTSK
jgi:hypothetical protein